MGSRKRKADSISGLRELTTTEGVTEPPPENSISNVSNEITKVVYTNGYFVQSMANLWCQSRLESSMGYSPCTNPLYQNLATSSKQKHRGTEHKYGLMNT